MSQHAVSNIAMPLLITSPAREKSSRPIFLTKSSTLNGSCPTRCRGAASARYPTSASVWLTILASPRPVSPSSVWARTMVRLRHSVPTTKVSRCVIFMFSPSLRVRGQARELCAGRGSLGVGVVTRQHLLPDPGPPDALPAERDGRRLQVCAAGVDVGRVPEAELDEHRRGDPDEVWYLVVPHEPPEVVWHLDVDVERQVGH